MNDPNKLGQITMPSINMTDLMSFLKKSVEDSIQDMEEISSTNPIIDFSSRLDKEGRFLLVSKVRFDEHPGSTISPNQYLERLIATQMIRTIISKKLNIG